MKKMKWFFLILASIFFQKVDAQVLINEYSAANYTQFKDNYGSTEDWVEFYNSSTNAVDISNYYLSDDATKPTKWQFPKGAIVAAKGFLRVWCSGRDSSNVATGHFHASFKLTQTKKKNENLTFSSPTKVLIDQQKVTETGNHQSWARFPDGASKWYINLKPTPNNSNTNAKVFKGFAEKPSVNIPAGFYPKAQTIALSTVDTTLTIRYTLTGKEPNITSSIYTKPILIDTIKVLKARSFSKDTAVLPSFVQFNTYFINKTHSMVVVSISGDSLELMANGNKNLKPVGSFEYFLKDKSKGSKGYGEYNPHGQDSWANDHRSIDFEMRDEFGYNSVIGEKMYDLTSRTEFQKVILRAAGDDNYPANFNSSNKGSAHMRDAYVQNLAKRGGLNLDVRVGEKAIVYLNGKYWGVYDLRERPDDHDYTKYNYNQDKYEIQYIQTWGNTWAEYGGTKALSDWSKLYTYIITSDVKQDSVYQQITSQLDVSSLADYMIVNSFTVCSDWLNYNTGWWRGLNPDGGHKKWGYTLWDNDATFAFYINYTGIKDTSANASICQHELLKNNSDPKGHVKVLNKLRQNKDFEQFYVTRQIELMNSVFTKQNMLMYFDSVYNVIKPEMPGQVKRWGGTMAGWETNVKRLRSFIDRRCDAVKNNIRPCYKLTGPYPLTLTAEPMSQVKEIKLNNITVTKFPFVANYYGGVDNKLSITQTNGTKYFFDKWLAPNSSFVSDSTKQTAIFRLNKADTLTAKFKLINGIDEENDNFSKQINVYPTVTSQLVNIDLDLEMPQNIQFVLFDINGNILQHSDSQLFVKGESQIVLDFNVYNLANGTYILQLKTDSNKVSKKLIYQR